MNNSKHILKIKKVNMSLSIMNLLLSLTISYFIYGALNTERETYFYSNEGYIKGLNYSHGMTEKINKRLAE